MDMILSFIIAIFYSFLGIVLIGVLLKYVSRKYIRSVVKYEILAIVGFSIFIMTFVSHLSVSSDFLDEEKIEISIPEKISIESNSFVSFSVLLENGYERSFQNPVLKIGKCEYDGKDIPEERIILLEPLSFIHSNSREMLTVELKVKNVKTGNYDCRVMLCEDYSCNSEILSKQILIDVI